MKRKLSVGDKAAMTMQASDETIRRIAQVSGDGNPIHLDEDYARNSIFKKRIAHGLFCMGLVSNVVGNQLPGEGSIFVDETVRYHRPVFIGDVITCEVAVSEIQENGKVLLSFACQNEEGKIVLDGTTLVKVLSV